MPAEPADPWGAHRRQVARIMRCCLVNYQSSETSASFLSLGKTSLHLPGSSY